MMGAMAGSVHERRRRIAVWALIVLASLLALLSSLTLWVNRQVLDNNGWENASSQIIRDPKVRAALSTYLVDQLYSHVNVEQSIQEQLPKSVKPLAGPLATALQQPAATGAAYILGLSRVRQLWVTAMDTAHQKLLNVLENKTGYGISTGNGVVTVNIHDLVVQLGGELGLPSSALQKIPDDTGVFTVMRSNQLSTVQRAVQLIRALSVWLVVLVVLLYGVAIYLARDNRRHILRDVGASLVIVGIVLLVIRRSAGNYVIGTLADPNYRAPLHQVWTIGTTVLGEIAFAVVFYGVIAIVAAWVAGPSSWATAFRRFVAPVLNRQLGPSAAIAGTAYLLLVLWGPTYALRTWWGVIMFAVVGAIGFAALRRQTLKEFPPADNDGMMPGTSA
jgi:hypothetical protein